MSTTNTPAKDDEWFNPLTRGYILVKAVEQTSRGERVRFHYGQVRRDGRREYWGRLSKSLSEFEATVRGLEKVKQ